MNQYTRTIRRAVKDAIIFLLICAPLITEAQQQFIFDKDGKLTTYPFSFPYHRHAKDIEIDADDYITNGYQKRLQDSIGKIANRLAKEFASNDSPQAKVVINIWGLDKLNDLRTDIATWKAYSVNLAPAAPPFLWINFPLVPDFNAIESKLLVYPGSEPAGVSLDMIPGFDGNDDPLVEVDSVHQEVRFRLVLDDPFKYTIFEKYKTKYPATLAAWDCHMLSGVARQLQDSLAAKIESTRALMADLENFDCDMPLDNTSLERYEEKYRYADSVHSESELPDKLYNILLQNPEFFLSLTWLGGNELKFNPLNFTSPENICPQGYSHKDSLYLQDRDTFNRKVEEYISKCPLCRLNKDSLVAILKERENGITYFPMSDSIKAQNANLAAFKSFQQVATNLYSFTFPYRVKDDSAGYVYQFDASKKFRRVDQVPLRRFWGGYSESDMLSLSQGRFKKLSGLLPDDKKTFLAIHNIPSDVKIKMTETQTPIVNESVFEKSLDSTTGAIGTLSSLVTTAAPAVAAAAAGLQPAPPTVFKDVSLTVGKATDITPDAAHFKLLSGEQKKYTAAKPVMTVLIGLPNGSKEAVNFIIENGRITGCDTLLGHILTRQAEFDSVDCPENVISFFWQTEDKSGYCRAASRDPLYYQNEFDTLIAHFKQYAENIEWLHTRILKMRAALASDFVKVRAITFIKKWQLPPKTLEADITGFSDTALYRTELRYPNTQSLSKDSYTLTYTKGKDTVPKVVATGSITTAPAHLIDAGIGAEATAGKVPLTSTASAPTGQLLINQDVQTVRAIVGLHLYPWKLFHLDNRFIIHRGYGATSWSRLSVFLGTGIPDPLHNWYSGLSADLVPGLRIQTGVHWLWYTRNQILNNQVQDHQSALIYGGWYFGITVSPVSGVKSLLGMFK